MQGETRRLRRFDDLCGQSIVEIRVEEHVFEGKRGLLGLELTFASSESLVVRCDTGNDELDLDGPQLREVDLEEYGEILIRTVDDEEGMGLRRSRVQKLWNVFHGDALLGFRARLESSDDAIVAGIGDDLVVCSPGEIDLDLRFQPIC